jgi:hypothetical protein
MVAASIALTMLANVAIATPIRADRALMIQSEAAVPGCALIVRSGRGYGEACDPVLNDDGGLDGLDVNLANRRFPVERSFGAYSGRGPGAHFPLRLGRPEQGRAPRGPGGIQVTEPATAFLLLIGTLAWRCVRRRS